MPQFYLVSHVATTTDYSNITDLEVMMVAGQVRLFVSTLYDGTLTSWALSGTGLTLVDTVTYLGGLRAGGTASIMQLEIDGQTGLLTGGGRGRGALQTHQLTEAGQFAENKVLPWTAFSLATLSHGETLTLGNGNQAVFGSLASGADMGCLVFNSAGTFQSFQELYDRADTFADDVTAISSARIGTAQYLLTASGTENGITVWAVSNTGDITPKSSLGTDDDLWVAAPTAMEVVTIGAKTYVVLASAGSSSLTVMSLDALGNLQVTDHVIDSQNSRFAGASALAVLEHQGQIYVITGRAGADVLFGGGGDDILTDGAGSDRLTGGLVRIHLSLPMTGPRIRSPTLKPASTRLTSRLGPDCAARRNSPSRPAHMACRFLMAQMC